MELAGAIKSLLIREGRQPVGLTAFLPLRRRLPLRLLVFNRCDLPTAGSRLWGLALVIILLLSPTGVSSWSSGIPRGHFASRIDLNLCLHGGVGCGVFVCYDQQFVEGFWLVAEELVLEEGAFSAPGYEVLDGLHLVSKLSPTREVVAS